MSMFARMSGPGRSEDYDHGLRFFDQGLYEQAIAELEKVAAPDSGADSFTRRLALFYIAQSCAQLGASAMENGRPDKAKEYLERALAQHPSYPDLYFQYGQAALAMQDTAGAREAFAEALRINPRYAKARLYQAIALYRAGTPEAAIGEARAALSMDASHGGEPFRQAEQAHETGDFENAALLFLAIADAQTDDASYHTKLGADLYRRGMYEQAAEEYVRALEINGDYADVRNALGITYYALGNPAAAAQEFEAALAINPNYADARANHVLALRALGRADESEAQRSAVLKIVPDHPIAREDLMGPSGA